MVRIYYGSMESFRLRMSADRASTPEKCREIFTGIEEGIYRVGRYLDDHLMPVGHRAANRYRNSKISSEHPKGITFYDSALIDCQERSTYLMREIQKEVADNANTNWDQKKQKSRATASVRRDFGPDHLARSNHPRWPFNLGSEARGLPSVT